MIFMVIEHFKNHDAQAVYHRFNTQGRMLPDGLRYIASWTTTDFDRCFQLMESDDPALFDQWTAHWNDLVEFEIFPILTGAQAAKAIESGNHPSP